MRSKQWGIVLLTIGGIMTIFFGLGLFIIGTNGPFPSIYSDSYPLVTWLEPMISKLGIGGTWTDLTSPMPYMLITTGLLITSSLIVVLGYWGITSKKSIKEEIKRFEG